ncbi:LysR family transcriptional regulator [Amycolatopsis japonica]|uniref:LysR family transcriptional regulator n=1 Tax=Amycolatopsis japonica TaxID=208439 RepID=UPI00381B66FC
MELEVRHLRLLCAVAESGSLTRAATVLGMSQPALSAQLQRIERFLGGALFVRDRTGVLPTPLGRLVLTKASAVVPTVDELIRASLRATQGGTRRHHFRLGSINTPLLSGLVGALRELHPGCEISTRQESSIQALLDHVSDGRLEAATVGYNPGYEFPARPGVVVRPVVLEPIFVLLPSTHRLADRSEVDLAELADEDWVLAPPDEDQTRQYFAAISGYPMRVRHEASGRLLVELVRSGCGIALAQPTIDEVPGAVVRPLAGSPLFFQHAISWHRDSALAPGESLLADRVAAAYETAVTRNAAYPEWRAKNQAT